MKPSRFVYRAILVAIIAQGLVLGGMVVRAALPLWTGSEIQVRTVPVDPRSLFRGNYARLNYSFSRVPGEKFAGEQPHRVGDVVYVVMEPGNDGYYQLRHATLQKPSSGVFLRGRVTRNYSPYRVRYGIEAWFAPKEKALALERELRDSGVATLMVTSGGQVALKDVHGTTSK